MARKNTGTTRTKKAAPAAETSAVHPTVTQATTVQPAATQPATVQATTVPAAQQVAKPHPPSL